jgi:hypothetical protein
MAAFIGFGVQTQLPDLYGSSFECLAGAFLCDYATDIAVLKRAFSQRFCVGGCSGERSC